MWNTHHTGTRFEKPLNHLQTIFPIPRPRDQEVVNLCCALYSKDQYQIYIKLVVLSLSLSSFFEKAENVIVGTLNDILTTRTNDIAS